MDVEDLTRLRHLQARLLTIGDTAAHAQRVILYLSSRTSWRSADNRPKASRGTVWNELFPVKLLGYCHFRLDHSHITDKCPIVPPEDRVALQHQWDKNIPRICYERQCGHRNRGRSQYRGQENGTNYILSVQGPSTIWSQAPMSRERRGSETNLRAMQPLD